MISATTYFICSLFAFSIHRHLICIMEKKEFNLGRRSQDTRKVSKLPGKSQKMDATGSFT
jgi:hypothetical protein